MAGEAAPKDEEDVHLIQRRHAQQRGRTVNEVFEVSSEVLKYMKS